MNDSRQVILLQHRFARIGACIKHGLPAMRPHQAIDEYHLLTRARQGSNRAGIQRSSLQGHRLRSRPNRGLTQCIVRVAQAKHPWVTAQRGSGSLLQQITRIGQVFNKIFLNQIALISRQIERIQIHFIVNTIYRYINSLHTAKQPIYGLPEQLIRALIFYTIFDGVFIIIEILVLQAFSQRHNGRLRCLTAGQQHQGQVSNRVGNAIAVDADDLNGSFVRLQTGANLLPVGVIAVVAVGKQIRAGT